jgi:hypothetical protein
MAVNTEITVCLDKTPQNLVYRYQRSEEAPTSTFKTVMMKAEAVLPKRCYIFTRLIGLKF